jgi:hypothetical protein
VPRASATVTAASEEDPCAPLLVRHRQRLQEPRPEVDSNCYALNFKTADGPFACERSGDAAWALVVDADPWKGWRELESGSDCFVQSPELRLSLVYRGASGEELARPGFTHFRNAWGTATLSIDTVFDYDGDGDPEVIVYDTADGEGTESEVYSVFSAKAAAIVPYAPAQGLQILVVNDADEDGRPDLVFPLHQAVTSEEGIVGDQTVFPSLARSLPGGTFAKNDAVVRAFEEKHCAALRHRGLVAKSGEIRDDVATGHAIVCARRRGAAERALLEELERACPSFGDPPRHGPATSMPANEPCPAWWKRWLEEERSGE